MKRIVAVAFALFVLSASALADMSNRGQAARQPINAAFGLHFDGSDVASTYTWWASAFGKAFGTKSALSWIVAMTDDRDPFIMQGNMEAYTVPGAPTSWGNGWAGSANKPKLVLSVPLAFTDLSLAQVAAGAADDAYSKGFSYLAQSGFQTIVLRIGWEQGGTTPGRNWMKWDEPYDSATYVAAYRRVHDIAVHALPHAKFEWNTSDPAAGTASYPGDDVVDVIGFDLYQFPSNAPGFAPHLADYERAVALATDHGKQVGFSEFGMAVDDPDFVAGFCSQITQLPASGPGSLAYWVLFQGTPNDGFTYGIGAFPHALAALRRCL